MAEEKKQRRIDRIDGRTVLFLTLCACIVTFFATSFLGHGIFTFCIFLILCWFGLYKQALGCFVVYLVAIVWLMIETKYQISIPSPLLLSMITSCYCPLCQPIFWRKSVREADSQLEENADPHPYHACFDRHAPLCSDCAA